MILINLLPHREAARKRRRENFFATLGLAALAGVLIAGAVYSWYGTQIDSQRDRNAFLKKEITKLDEQISDIKTLEKDIASLRARQNAVEDLQGNRNMPVHLLNEMVKQLPDGVYITSLKQEDDSVLITGVAQSSERVSELLRNFGNHSQWLTKPDLKEITSSVVTLSARDQRRVSNFTMSVGINKANAPTPAVSAPAAAVVGALDKAFVGGDPLRIAALVPSGQM